MHSVAELQLCPTLSNQEKAWVSSPCRGQLSNIQVGLLSDELLHRLCGVLVGSSSTQDSEPLWGSLKSLRSRDSCCLFRALHLSTQVCSTLLSCFPCLWADLYSDHQHAGGECFLCSGFLKAENAWVFRKTHHVLILALLCGLCCSLPRAASFIHRRVPAAHRLILRKLCAGEMQPDSLFYEIIFFCWPFSSSLFTDLHIFY